MVEKGPGIITDAVRNFLKVAACDLHLKQWDRMPIANDICEGIIQTDWQTYCIGSRAGILFRSQISSEGAEDYSVNFLLSTEDLENGAALIQEIYESEGGEWRTTTRRFPIKELYEFHDLRRSSAKH